MSAKGKGTQKEPMPQRDDLKIGQQPSSKSNPKGKGQGVLNPTGKGIYSENTGVT